MHIVYSFVMRDNVDWNVFCRWSEGYILWDISVPESIWNCYRIHNCGIY